MANNQNRLDIEDLRRRFGSQLLSRQLVHDPDEDGRIVPPVPAVTLRYIRGGPGQPLEGNELNEKTDFGPLANANLFNNVFAIEPVFKQFVVSNCNTGIFAGRPSHVNCVKMIQLICMVRLHLRNALSGQAVTRQAFYQAMAMGEAMGPSIPEGWKLNQAEANAEIIRVAEWLLTEDGIAAINLTAEEWFDAELLGVNPNVFTTGRVNNIGDALVLIEAMAVRLPSNNVWLSGVSFISSILLALCRRGNATDELRSRVEQGVREATSSASVNLGPATMKRFYSIYCANVDATNAGRLFEHFQTLIPDNVIALRNLVVQAAGSGLTTYMVILRAMSDYANFDWARLMSIIGPEFRKLDTAVATVAGNVYFGFNHQMAAASAKNFPNLAYASFQLCIKAGGDNPLKRYGGMPAVVPCKVTIDQMVTDYIDARADALAAAVVEEDIRNEWTAIAGRANQAHLQMSEGAVRNPAPA